MQTFNDIIQERSILYAIDSDSNIYQLNVIESNPQHNLGKKTNEIYGYDITVQFTNANETLYKIFLSAKELKQNIKLVKIFDANFNEYINKKNPYYLIGTDKKTLIKNYIDKLDESIMYQNEVVNDGLAQIKHLQKIKDNLYDILRSNT